MDKPQENPTSTRAPSAKITHRTVVLVSLPLLFELLFATILFLQLNQAQAEMTAELHAKDVIYQATRLNNSIFDAAFAMAGYSMTKSPLFYSRYTAVADTIPPQISTITATVKGDQKSTEIANRLTADWTRTTAAVKDAKAMIEEAHGLSLSQISLYAEIKASTSRLKHDTGAITDAYVAIANAAPKAKEQTRNAIIVSIIIGLIGSFALTIWLASSFDRELRRRLKRLIENTARLAQHKQLGPPVGGPNDEIALLDADFRRMATELEEASQKERDIVDFASDVICSIAEDGTVTRINPASTSMWGFMPTELVGRSYLSLLPEDQHSQIRTKFQEARTQSTITVAEAAINTRDGSRSFVTWSIRWSTARNSYYCVVHDITDRKAVETMKQQFLAMVSHDLRSPLASLTGTLEILKVGGYGAISELASDRVDKAQNTANWLMNMVNDLLEVERMDSGFQITTQHTKIPALIEHSIEQVRALADAKNINFVLGPLQTETAFCDPDRLQQVFVNLISNAVKFSPAQSPIYIGVFKEADSIEFRVKDRGKGVPADKQALIFERFKQASKEDARGENKGFGLGLPICKMIVEAHGGTMGVHSSPDEGSTFWFRIPFVVPSKSGNETAVSGAKA